MRQSPYCYFNFFLPPIPLLRIGKLRQSKIPFCALILKIPQFSASIWFPCHGCKQFCICIVVICFLNSIDFLFDFLCIFGAVGVKEVNFRRRRVPAFGSWDCDDNNLPFTQCFESARQAGLLRCSYSEDRDLYVAGDLYENDVVTPAMIVVPRHRVFLFTASLLPFLIIWLRDEWRFWVHWNWLIVLWTVIYMFIILVLMSWTVYDFSLSKRSLWNFFWAVSWDSWSDHLVVSDDTFSVDSVLFCREK